MSESFATWALRSEKGEGVMTSTNESQVLRLTTEAAIRLALLTALVAGCLRIVWPFLLPVIWGTIIAIAVWPIIRRLTAVIGGRQKTASALFVLLALAILIVPSWLVAESVTQTVIHAGERLASGEVTVPAPPEQVADWPIIGGKLDRVWTAAVENPPAAIEAFRPQIIAVGGVLLSSVAGLGMGVLLFAFSIILAGVFLATAKGGANAARTFCIRVAGEERGLKLQETATDTVSSVVKGVLGVAAVQGVAATIGMLLVGVPAATTWGLLVLLLAVVQLPPFLILAPMCFYVFSTTGTVGAVLFTIWAIIVSVSDTFLKPLFLGRGVEVPMLVILLGAIGGMLAWGVLGLFVGAVVLAVGYQLVRAWFEDPEFAPQAAAESG
jgi:predicted PurR-regulated permease PerM